MPIPKRSKIGFCDYSAGDLNYVIGCTPASVGCANCYARRIYKTFGKDFSKVTIYPEKLERLRKWQPKPPYKRGPGSRPLAFPVDMGDLFHKEVSEDFILRAFWTMQYRHDIDWLVFTKRAIRMRRLLQFWDSGDQGPYHPAENIWLIVSVENRDNLWRIDELVRTPAAVRGVSLEPMLEPMDLSPWLLQCECGARPYADHRESWRYIGPERHHHHGYPVGHVRAEASPLFDWIIIGGESGPKRKRRPFEERWAWDIRDQGQYAGIPVFLKQASGIGPGVPLLSRDGEAVKEWPR